MLAVDADNDSVSRSLDTHLLWLFGYIMFNNGHGNSVNKILINYAREIVNAEEDEVSLYSWGSIVLAATYHGLCEGCPLLLQLWSYERLAVGRPMISHVPYGPEFYKHGDEDSRPTIGTLWLWR